MIAGLWFDVEKKNYTTWSYASRRANQLWFDVEKKNYTTVTKAVTFILSCGLMQKRRIIQQTSILGECIIGCGLMQKRRIIQL